METEKGKNILHLFFARVKKMFYSKRIGVFLFFLIISSILWLLNELDNQYTARISYPISYTNFPDQKVHVGELPSKLNLKVKGKGFKILEYKISNNLNPVELSVGAYNLYHSEENKQSVKFYILTSTTQNRLSQQLSSEVEILEISPDTLFFEFAERIQKKVPVNPNIKYTLEEQLMLKEEVQLEPDSVVISGPSSVLDTVSEVSTKYYEFLHLNKDISKEIPLKISHEQLEITPGMVTLNLRVEQFNEGELTIDIRIVNKPDSVMLRLFPNNVRINYLVGLSNYESVIEELFEATVDYQDIEEGNKEKLEVDITKYPDYLKSFSYHPKEVDYIIEKND